MKEICKKEDFWSKCKEIHPARAKTIQGIYLGETLVEKNIKTTPLLSIIVGCSWFHK